MFLIYYLDAIVIVIIRYIYLFTYLCVGVCVQTYMHKHVCVCVFQEAILIVSLRQGPSLDMEILPVSASVVLG